MSLLKPTRLSDLISETFKVFKGMPLQSVLVIPFVLQIFGTVGLVGYISYKNSQLAINNLVDQLMSKVSNLVEQHLDSYLTIPPQINRINVDAIALGRLNLQDYQTAGQLLWKQGEIFDVSFISYGLATGEFVGAGAWIKGQGSTIDELSPRTKGKNYTYATDSAGNRTKVVLIDDKYQPLRENWYTKPVQAGKPVWSEVYPWNDHDIGALAIAANHPIYNNNKLVGVLSVDLLLSKISNFLQDLKISPSGKIFIIEQDGQLIATSTTKQPFTLVNGKAQRLNILNSSDRTLQATAQYIKSRFGNFSTIQNNQKLEFKLDQQLQFVQITPWRDNYGLDWLVVAVVPESDFMAQINANNQTTILLCLAALFSATLLGIITARWITRPIHHLGEASIAISNGDLSQNVEVKSIKEIEILSKSFNSMALQLKESFEQLETRVEQRTTELNAARKAAEAANHAKSEFLANMSHELRTPLNAILGFSKLMYHDSSLTPDQQENLEIINHSGEHLLSLINDVLDMSKIKAGRIVLNISNFDLYRLLDTVTEIFQLKAADAGLQLSIERTPEVPQYVRSDESKLRQILINLVGNALKFTHAGGVIIRVSKIDHPQANNSNYHLLFEVEDTGTGIKQDELESLFQAFVQTEAGRNLQQGTGLGLTISRKFVQLLGGDITVESTLGEGTTFQFYIQLDSAPATENIQPPQPQRRVIGLAPGQLQYRILVVDDHSVNRRLLTKMLTSVGLEVRAAENGQQAIALWLSWEPHLIWMDMRMPVMNGYEATAYIKSHLQGQATAIIALTASTFEEERAIVIGTGCDDFVRKPFREEVIWEKMAQHLGLRYVYEITPGTASKPVTELTSQTLSVMPNEWVAQLYNAATQLNGDLIKQLITQIPEEHNALAIALQQKVHNFDFDQIMHLAQPGSTP